MDYTDQLQRHMQQAELTTLTALYNAAQVSPGSVKRLRSGQVTQMQLGTLLRLSHALRLPLSELITQFSAENVTLKPTIAPQTTAQAAMAKDRSQGTTASESERQQGFQHTSLQILESWLLQWPTAAHAAQANDHIPAARLVPLVAPVNQLLQSWGVTTIGEVGQEVAYAPQVHQIMSGHAQPGDPVRIRYVGYRHQGNLLHRAKVSPVSP
ncbi:MAG: helix-turn-helix transcriptional regulator [Elainellaceae cyanobacterium]